MAFLDAQADAPAGVDWRSFDYLSPVVEREEKMFCRLSHWGHLLGCIGHFRNALGAYHAYHDYWKMEFRHIVDAYHAYHDYWKMAFLDAQADALHLGWAVCYLHYLCRVHWCCCFVD
jgi:hypothetical protein